MECQKKDTQIWLNILEKTLHTSIVFISRQLSMFLLFGFRAYFGCVFFLTNFGIFSGFPISATFFAVSQPNLLRFWWARAFWIGFMLHYPWTAVWTKTEVSKRVLFTDVCKKRAKIQFSGKKINLCIFFRKGRCSLVRNENSLLLSFSYQFMTIDSGKLFDFVQIHVIRLKFG